MARPIRLEYAGALYHVTSRGDRREDIYADDCDRTAWVAVLAHTCERFRWRVHAYCLMSNHYHVLVETPEGNLSAGMRHLNGVYTQQANRRHRRVGHVFQGRYKAVLVDDEAYLLEVARYVVLNPVRAGMVADAADWPWSSYRATAGLAPAPDWLHVDALLTRFGKTRGPARRHFAEHVRQGVGQTSLWSQLRQQVYLGDEAFVARAQKRAAAALPDETRAIEVPLAQRRPPAPSLDHFVSLGEPRHAAMARAYATGAYTLADVGRAFGVHYATVSRAVRRSEEAADG